MSTTPRTSNDDMSVNSNTTNNNTQSPPRRQEDERELDVQLFVKGMLDQMESEFTEAGNSILGRMDEMGKRMDELERSISDLMGDAGLETPKTTKEIMTPSTSPNNDKMMMKKERAAVL